MLPGQLTQGSYLQALSGTQQAKLPGIDHHLTPTPAPSPPPAPGLPRSLLLPALALPSTQGSMTQKWFGAGLCDSSCDFTRTRVLVDGEQEGEGMKKRPSLSSFKSSLGE